MEGHSDEACGVAVTPNGQRAVSDSKEKTPKVWFPSREPVPSEPRAEGSNYEILEYPLS